MIKLVQKKKHFSKKLFENLTLCGPWLTRNISPFLLRGVRLQNFHNFLISHAKVTIKHVQHARRRVFYSSDLRPFVTPVSVADKARSEVTILTVDLTLTWHVTF